MKAVLQRVLSAWVVVDGKEVGRVGRGLLVLLGVAKGDGEKEAELLADKTVRARVFAGEKGHFDLSLKDVDGALLVVSQFTLCGRTNKGRRPSLDDAAPPEVANPLYLHFVEHARRMGFPVETGLFGAEMAVHMVGDGPVTFIYEVK